MPEIEVVARTPNIKRPKPKPGAAFEGEQVNRLQLEQEKIVREISELKKDRLSVIESIGIFTFLFTFISIEFQVFQSYRDPLAISGLSLILLGSISFLLVLFDFFIKRTIDDIKFADFFKQARTWFVLIPLVVIACGMYLFCQTDIESLEKQAEKIKDEVLIQKDIKDVIQESEKNGEVLNCLKIKGYYTNKCFE